MRIAFLLSCFPYTPETFILRQITGLIDLGHEVDIYSESRPENGNPVHSEVAKYELLKRTRYIDMPLEAGYWELPVVPIMGRTWIPETSESRLNAIRALRAVPAFTKSFANAPRLALRALSPAEYGYQAESLSTLYRLAALCSNARSYDVIHAHYGPIGRSFRFARELWQAPLVVTFHGFDFSSWPREQGEGVYERLFDVVDMVTVNSEYTRSRLELLGCPPHKIETLHVGIYPDDFPFHERVKKPGQPIRILTVARLTEKKGLEYGIRAVAEARQQFTELRYDIIGEGPNRSDLESLISQLGMQDAIVLHGARDSTYIRRWMSDAHLFMLPSVTAADGDQEGTPVALMEAQAAGLPVLSTHHSGISEVVLDGKTGFLVKERDVDGLTEQLVHLLEHSDSWPELGRAGRRRVEDQFSLIKLNRQLVDLYDQAIQGARERKA
jgi:colanic acid/amylovoran biosynthesis glycosyltransferase